MRTTESNGLKHSTTSLSTAVAQGRDYKHVPPTLGLMTRKKRYSFPCLRHSRGYRSSPVQSVLRQTSRGTSWESHLMQEAVNTLGCCTTHRRKHNEKYFYTILQDSKTKWAQPTFRIGLAWHRAPLQWRDFRMPPRRVQLFPRRTR